MEYAFDNEEEEFSDEMKHWISPKNKIHSSLCFYFIHTTSDGRILSVEFTQGARS